MKVSKQLIALLTQGQTNYAEICQVFGVSETTARQICRGGKVRYVTAQKIEAVFQTYPLKQIFRNPLKGYEAWKKQAGSSVLLQKPAKTNITNLHTEPTVAEAATQPVQNNMNNLNQPPVEHTANAGHPTQPRCLYPECPAPYCHARGLCPEHYWAARDYVRKGKVTWAKLVAEGKALAGEKHSRSDAGKWFLGDPSATNVEHQ